MSDRGGRHAETAHLRPARSAQRLSAADGGRLVSPPSALQVRRGVIVECRADRANCSGPSWARSTVPPRGATLQEPVLAEMLPADFSVRLVAGGDRTVVVVCGELDLLTAAAFGGFLDVAASRPGHLVVIDLAGVAFIGASALGQLARILPRLRAAGSELAVVSPSPMAYEVLDLTGYTAQLPVEQPSRDGQ